MRSFRLDPESVAEFLDSWPTLLVGGVLAGVLVYFGIGHPWVQTAAMILCGVYCGFRLRGLTSARLRRQYPNARFHWLLSIGMTTFIVGFLASQAFPEIRGTGFNLAWLGVSFASILAFVIANRKDEDIVR